MKKIPALPVIGVVAVLVAALGVVLTPHADAANPSHTSVKCVTFPGSPGALESSVKVCANVTYRKQTDGTGQVASQATLFISGSLDGTGVQDPCIHVDTTSIGDDHGVVTSTNDYDVAKRSNACERDFTGIDAHVDNKGDFHAKGHVRIAAAGDDAFDLHVPFSS